MANSKSVHHFIVNQNTTDRIITPSNNFTPTIFEYVRNFERDEILLPSTWIVVRIDGRGFHKLSNIYNFTKPNDPRALHLMNRAAQSVFRSVPDLCIAYGVSDEYSFVFHESTTLFDRRASKLVSTVVSAFTAAYVFHWGEYFGRCSVFKGRRSLSGGGKDGGDDDDDVGQDENDNGLQEDWMPTFDGRAVCYPSIPILKDYLSWRQADCHINNLYNTTFWTLVQKDNQTPTQAENLLKGTVAADKNEILFSQFGINYNNEEELYKKGSVVFREYQLVASPTSSSGDVDGDGNGNGEALGEREPESKGQKERNKKARQKAKIVVRHLDIIGEEFWRLRPWILSGRPGVPLSSGGTSTTTT